MQTSDCGEKVVVMFGQRKYATVKIQNTHHIPSEYLQIQMSRIAGKKSSDTLANGDAQNKLVPACFAVTYACSIRARARDTVGWSCTACIPSRSAGLVRIICLIRRRTSGLSSRSTCEKSSRRNRCHASPLKKKIHNQLPLYSNTYVAVGTHWSGTTMLDAVSRIVMPKLQNLT